MSTVIQCVSKTTFNLNTKLKLKTLSIQFPMNSTLQRCYSVYCSNIDLMQVSSSFATVVTLHVAFFRRRKLSLALATTGDDVINKRTKISWMLSWLQFCLALHPAPALKFLICLFQASNALSHQTAMGLPSKISNSSQLWANI